MKTTFYIATQIKKSNGVLQWFNTKHYDTEEQARPVYESRMAKPNATEVILWKQIHYDAVELIPRFAKMYPDGMNDYRAIAVHSRI